MHSFEHLNVSHLTAKKVTYSSLLNDLKSFPESTHVDRAKRLKCCESSIRRMLKMLKRLSDEYEAILKEVREKNVPIEYNPHHIFGYDASNLLYQLQRINKYPHLEKYINEETKEFLMHVIKDLKSHPESEMNERIRRLCLVKIHTYTRYNLWSVIFLIRWLNKRADAYAHTSE